MRQRAADGDVDKQQPQRGVGELAADAVVEIAALEQQRQQRHRRRFGDERAQQRAQQQRREVEGGAFARRNQPRRQGDERFRQFDHRTRGRHDHDDEDKLRFREVQTLDVFHGVLKRPVKRRDPEEQHGRPQPEDHLGFRQEVQQVLLDRARRVPVRPMRKAFHAKGVQHRQAEQHRGEQLSNGGTHGKTSAVLGGAEECPPLNRRLARVHAVDS